MSNLRHTVQDEAWFLIRAMRSRGAHGVSVAPHAHPWPQLLVTVRGVLTIWTEVGSWVVPPQSAVWAPAGIRHGLRYSGEVELQALWFRPDAPGPALPHETGVVVVSTLLAALVSRSVEIGMLDERVATHRALTLLIGDALATRAVPSFELPMPRAPQLLHMINTAEASSYALSTHALAAQAAMSVRTLERRFAEDVGVALGSWMRHARMVEGLRQLGAGVSLKHVAHRAGYRSVSAFAYAFRRRFGVSPGQYFSGQQAATDSSQ